MAAIYQSARPATFEQIVGQDHVKSVLLAAVRQGRTSHAYLFSGPRGVGKTTTARLLAMALNCETQESARRPCGSCEGCRLVREGHHPDVIELDAASNNSVDDVRELREKTSLAAMRGGSRVWILDEAHMLSRPAANALLKTLEEPPPGLVFILATTEPEKLPATVLSRCQHFRFRRLAEPEILGKLGRLCREAGVAAEDEALALVARAADGAMRDAESLLERLLTTGEAITLAGAEDALGLPPVQRMQRLATALAAADLGTLLSEAEALYRDGFAPRSLAENLGGVLRDALRAEVVGGGSTSDGTASFRLPLERQSLMRLIHALDDEQDRFIRRDDLYSLEVALIKGINSLAVPVPAPADQRETEQRSGDYAGAGSARPSAGEEQPRGSTRPAPGAPVKGDAGKKAETSRLPSFDPTGRAPGRSPAKPTTKPTANATTTADGNAETVAAPGGETTEHPPGRESSPAGDEAPQAESPQKRLDWHKVRTVAGPQLKAFLMPARESVEGDQITIRYGDMHRFHFSELKKREEELVRLIEEVGGPGFRLRIEGPEEPTAKKY